MRESGTLRIVAVVAAIGALTAGCTSSPDPPPPTYTVNPFTLPTGPSTSAVATPTPSRTWTFFTNQAFCPVDRWHDVAHWVPLQIETTSPQEAAIQTELGACVSDTGDATYLVNSGGTAWSIDTAAAIEHYYPDGEPDLLWALREEGYAQSALGPHEEAYIAAEPSSVSWSIDVPTTVTASTVGQMANDYAGDDFTHEALEAWRKASTQRGSPNKMLAVCANSAYATAQREWITAHDAQAVLKDVEAALATGGSVTSCLAAVSEFDEARAEKGLEPVLGPLLRSRTFEVAGQNLSWVEEAAKAAGTFLARR